MGLKIVCHTCSHILFEGFELIPFFKLRDELDGKCPNCKRKLAIRPITVQLINTKKPKNNNTNILKTIKPPQ